MTTFAERYLNRRMILELAPAIVFFVANYGWGLMVATAAVMVATLTTTVVGIATERRVPALAVVTLALVLVLGGAGLVFENEVFIKVKSTIGNVLFALALAIGLGFRESLLQRALTVQLDMTEEGWRVLTLCWIAFALFLAATNELAWRLLDTDSWVTVKTAKAPLSILCYILITRIVAERYWREDA